MKKYSILLIAGAMAALSLGSCKTTEANYRQAYESARQKQTQEGDSAITAGLNNQARPRSMEFDGVTLPVLTTGVSIPKDGGMELSHLKKFNSVAGVFRQIFNAKSMRERLCSRVILMRLSSPTLTEPITCLHPPHQAPPRPRPHLTNSATTPTSAFGSPYPTSSAPATSPIDSNHIIR